VLIDIQYLRIIHKYSSQKSLENYKAHIVLGVGKIRQRENKRTSVTTQEYNVETPKPEKKTTTFV
jgi:hypothetical protein